VRGGCCRFETLIYCDLTEAGVGAILGHAYLILRGGSYRSVQRRISVEDIQRMPGRLRTLHLMAPVRVQWRETVCTDFETNFQTQT
jgi:hypothetical protein